MNAAALYASPGTLREETSLSLSLRMCSWPAAVQLIGSGKEASDANVKAGSPCVTPAKFWHVLAKLDI